MLTIGEIWEQQQARATQTTQEVSTGAVEQPKPEIKKKFMVAFPTDRLALHQPHTDEGGCVWILKSGRFPEVAELFPGAKDAPLELWTLGQTVEPAKGNRVLFLGCGGGEVDEHELDPEEYRQTSAAEMLVDLLKINDPALRAVVSIITTEDRWGAKDQRSIHAVLKQIHRMDHPYSYEEVLEWVGAALDAQYRFFKSNTKTDWTLTLTLERARDYIKEFDGEDAAEKWFDFGNRALVNFKARKGRMMVKLEEDKNRGKESVHWHPIKIASGGSRKDDGFLVAMKTDSFEAMKAAMTVGASVTLIEQKSGNSQIFGNRPLRIDLTEVALAFRVAELEKMYALQFINKKPVIHHKNPQRKLDEFEFTVEELSVRGHVKRWPKMQPYWYLHDVPGDAANQFYNGTESANGVPPSNLTFEERVELLKKILGGQFHDEFYQGCLEGKCAGNKCPWFAMNLTRCTEVRDGTFMKQKELRANGKAERGDEGNHKHDHRDRGQRPHQHHGERRDGHYHHRGNDRRPQPKFAGARVWRPTEQPKQ